MLILERRQTNNCIFVKFTIHMTGTLQPVNANTQAFNPAQRQKMCNWRCNIITHIPVIPKMVDKSIHVVLTYDSTDLL